MKEQLNHFFFVNPFNLLKVDSNSFSVLERGVLGATFFVMVVVFDCCIIGGFGWNVIGGLNNGFGCCVVGLIGGNKGLFIGGLDVGGKPGLISSFLGFPLPPFFITTK